MEENPFLYTSNNNKLIEIHDDNSHDDDDLISIRVEDSEYEDDDYDDDDVNNEILNINYEQNIENIKKDEEEKKKQNELVVALVQNVQNNEKTNVQKNDHENIDDDEDDDDDETLLIFQTTTAPENDDHHDLPKQDSPFELDFEGFASLDDQTNDEDIVNIDTKPDPKYEVEHLALKIESQPGDLKIELEPFPTQGVELGDSTQTNNETTKNGFETVPDILKQLCDIKHEEPLLIDDDNNNFSNENDVEVRSEIEVSVNDDFSEITSILNDHSYLSKEQVTDIINNKKNTEKIDPEIKNLINFITENLNNSLNNDSYIETSLNVINRLTDSLISSSSLPPTTVNSSSSNTNTNNNIHLRDKINIIENQLNLIKLKFNTNNNVDQGDTENNDSMLVEDQTINDNTIDESIKLETSTNDQIKDENLQNSESVCSKNNETEDLPENISEPLEYNNQTNTETQTFEEYDCIDLDTITSQENELINITEAIEKSKSSKQTEEKDDEKQIDEVLVTTKEIVCTVDNTIENEIQILVQEKQQQEEVVENLDDKVSVELDDKVSVDCNKFVELENLGSKIIQKSKEFDKLDLDEGDKGKLNEEMMSFILELRKEINNLIHKYDIYDKLNVVQTTQTDEKVSIESAKKLNESYKRRHLASSSSDMSSLDDTDDEYYFTKKRRKRVKKFKRHPVKSNSNSEFETKMKTDDDLMNGETSMKESGVNDNNNQKLDTQNELISVTQDDVGTEHSEKNYLNTQPEFDISEFLLRKPKPIDDDDHLQGPEKNDDDGDNIFNMPTQKFIKIKSNHSSDVETDILDRNKPNAEIQNTENVDKSFFDCATQESNRKKSKTDKLEGKTEEEQNDLLREIEINKSTNFSNLEIRRSSSTQKQENSSHKKVKKQKNLIDIIKEGEKKDDSDDSSSDNDMPETDEQFLRQKNLEQKWSLLNSSDSDDEIQISDESDVDMDEIEKYIESSSEEKSSDESSDIDKFLELMNKKTIEKEINETIGKQTSSNDDDEIIESINENKKKNFPTNQENTDVCDNRSKDALPVLEKENENKKMENDNVNAKINQKIQVKMEDELIIDEIDNITKPNDNQPKSEFDIALENFLKEDSSNQEEVLNQVIESGGINEDEVDKAIHDETKGSNEVGDHENNKESLMIDDNIDNKPDKNKSKPTEKSRPVSPESKSMPIAKRFKDSIEKEVFSKSLLDDDDESTVENILIHDSDKKEKSKPNTTIEDTTNVDSDCEILDVSMFQTKRKPKEQTDIIQLLKSSKKPKLTTENSNTTSSKDDDDCIYLSSDSDLDLEEVVRADGNDDDDNETDQPGKKPRAILTDDQLTVETKQAQKEESERVKRLEKKNEIMSQRLSQMLSQSQEVLAAKEESQIILDYDTKRKQNICVHPEIVKHLKPHQVDGVKFMYDSCYGSVDSIEKYPGSGCILAHCMGLGKTLQLIAVLHTVIRYPQLKTNKILVICPKSTVMNWSDEIKRWLGPIKTGPKLKILHFPDNSDINEKMKLLKEWQSCGTPGNPKSGCFLVGYEAFRTLVFYHLSKKKNINIQQAQLDYIKKTVEDTLLNPGADLVICDEGHVIKNKKSATNVAVSQVKTRRRIILTGTPIQNNLKEYYCMVNFIKPSFLGTEKEFANLYANPIKSGQHKDSSKSEIKFMKQRSFVLHKKLSKFVQRREAAVLKTFLPEKYEYVLFIPMTPIQEKLYQYFLENNAYKEKYGGKSLIPDYTFLRKIWTHPKVLENAWLNATARKEKEKVRIRKLNLESEDEMPDDELDSQIGKMSVTNDWWRQQIAPEDLESLVPSNKLRVMFEILKLCSENGEKCLIFSAFVAVLNVVEFFMNKIHKRDESTCRRFGLERFRGPWVLGEDYYRLDGKTSKTVRHLMITNFNNPQNIQTKCFLISAKAGGQGINLIGANRVIILDTSWNPSNDQQNIFRIFRLGQKRPCYVYRLLAMGTMEEKVYSRSVTKQAMSFRVVDEQQIDRHYNMAELAELYTLTKTDYLQRPVPIRPYDNLLSCLLHNLPELVYKYHEHDSLLENKPEQDLSEADKAEAWAAYEKDVNMQRNAMMDHFGADMVAAQNYRMSGGSLLYPYNYSRPGGFGLNNPNYPPNLNSSMLPGFLSPYSSLLNLSTDPNIMRIRQMYNNQAPGSYQSPYANLNSPTGQSNPLSNPFNVAAQNLYGGNIVNQQQYFKSMTPPTPQSTIRPMSGGFASLSDMANFLAVPSPNTPPPPNIPISSASSANPASFLNRELDNSMWKNFFNNNPLNVFPPSTTQSSVINVSTHNLNTSSPSPITVSSNSNILNAQKTVHHFTNAMNNPHHKTQSSTPTSIVQPSIPTSVITKQLKPTLPPPKEQILPQLNTLTSVAGASSLSGRYSPQSHVIVKNSKPTTSTTNSTALTIPTLTASTITTTAHIPTSPSLTAAQSTLVKNFNMGIVYPGQTDNSSKPSTVNPTTGLKIVSSTPSTTTAGISLHNFSNSNSKNFKNNNSSTSIIDTSIKPHVIRKSISSIGSTSTGKQFTIPPSLNRSNSVIGSTSLLKHSSVSTPPTSHLNQNNMVYTTKKSVPTTTNIASGSQQNKTKQNSFQLPGININELSKASGLSITPVNSSPKQTNHNQNQIINPMKQNKNVQSVKGITVKHITLAKTSATNTITTTPIKLTQSKSVNANSTTIATPLPTKSIRRGSLNNNNTSLITVNNNSSMMQVPQLVPVHNSNQKRMSGDSSNTNSNNIRYVFTQSQTPTNSTNVITTKPISNQNKVVPPLVFSRNNSNTNTVKPNQFAVQQVKRKSTNQAVGQAIMTPPLNRPQTSTHPMLGIRSQSSDSLKKKNNLSDLASNSSLTITELKKNHPAKMLSIDKSIKKVKSFSGVTIVPRNLQNAQNLTNTKKDNVVDIVELD